MLHFATCEFVWMYFEKISTIPWLLLWFTSVAENWKQPFFEKITKNMNRALFVWTKISRFWRLCSKLLLQRSSASKVLRVFFFFYRRGNFCCKVWVATTVTETFSFRKCRIKQTSPLNFLSLSYWNVKESCSEWSESGNETPWLSFGESKLFEQKKNLNFFTQQKCEIKSTNVWIRMTNQNGFFTKLVSNWIWVLLKTRQTVFSASAVCFVLHGMLAEWHKKLCLHFFSQDIFFASFHLSEVLWIFKCIETSLLLSQFQFDEIN